MFDAIIAKCVAAEGATEQDVANMKGMLVPIVRSEMCLHACIMEHIGVVSI